MSTFAFTKGMSGIALGGIAAVAAVVAGLYVSGMLFPEPESAPDQAPDATRAPDTVAPVEPEPAVEGISEQEVAKTEPEPAPTADAEEVETPSESVADETLAAPESEAVAEDAPDIGTENGVATETETPEPTAPTFDIVRVAPDGQTLVAGVAPAASDVRVMVDGVEAGTAGVDGSGQFVAFLDLPSSDVPRVVSLMAEGAFGTVESLDQVILAPSVAVAAVEPPRADPEPAPETVETEAAALPTPETVDTTAEDPPVEEPVAVETADVTAETDPAAPATEPEVAAEDTSPPAAEEEAPAVATEVASAPAVILSTEEGVDVLQTPGPTPDVLDQIALDAITYEDAGAVTLTGRGTVDEFVRIYIDNRPILTTEIAPDGRWRADLPDVDSGTYTLRVDAVDAEGAVTSRVESPFLREDPDLLAQSVERGEGSATVQVVTVQPGNTLWAIARDRYGEGLAYVRVFEANRDRIRDPDLIYPGQVFSIPN